MRDLSMHVLDIAQNSIKAGATLVTITFEKYDNNMLRFTVEDDGCGMSQEFLQQLQFLLHTSYLQDQHNHRYPL